jgi:hypothetical protein
MGRLPHWTNFSRDRYTGDYYIPTRESINRFIEELDENMKKILDKQPKRVYSELDPYGEENWD